MGEPTTREPSVLKRPEDGKPPIHMDEGEEPPVQLDPEERDELPTLPFPDAERPQMSDFAEGESANEPPVHAEGGDGTDEEVA